MYEKEGRSINSIALEFAVYRTTVIRNIIRAGGKFKLNEGRKFKTNIIKEWANLYSAGKSISDIAKQYKTTASCVQNRLMQDFEINMRRTRIFTEDHKQKLSNSLKGRTSWNKGKSMSLEQRKKISESVKKVMNTPEMSEYMSKTMKGKLTGSNHPSWQGGISQKYKKGYTNTYSHKFNKNLKKSVLIRDDYNCTYCKNIDDLSIHHIDYNKHNSNPENLITTCRSCNGKFNFNREFWKIFWQSFMTEYIKSAYYKF